VTGRCTPDRYSGVRGGMTSSTHRDLAAWREAMSLVEIVYRACVRFPSMRTRARPQAEPPHRLWPKPVRVRVSSRLKQIHPPRRCAWRRLRAQPQVRENALDQLDDLQLTPRATDSRAVNWGVYEFVPALKCNRDGRLMAELRRPSGRRSGSVERTLVKRQSARPTRARRRPRCRGRSNVQLRI
jgi:hypothetical protein